MERYQLFHSSLKHRSGAATMRLTMLCGALVFLATCAGPLWAQEPAPPGGFFGKNRSLLNIIHDGGYVMYPILLCSFTLVVFTLERAISLRGSRIIPGPFTKRLTQQLQAGQIDREQALLVCEENQSIAARVMTAGIKKWGRSAVEMEQALIDAGERASHELRRFLRVFSALATVGPLLGLLGTVLGIIQAFQDISGAEAMGRMELLSRSISEALFTTASGLAVAIPAVVLSLYFSSCVDRLLIRLDALGQDVVEAISGEALSSKSGSRSKKAA